MFIDCNSQCGVSTPTQQVSFLNQTNTCISTLDKWSAQTFKVAEDGHSAFVGRFNLEAGGKFKVCVCDSTRNTCDSVGDYDLEVGKVYNTGIYCIFNFFGIF